MTLRQNRIIICGCRDFNDYDFAMPLIFHAISNLVDIEIVSGHCTDKETGEVCGADAIGERFAKEGHIPLALFPADWARYGNPAGPIRNREMAGYGTHYIAIWDGISRGTKNMINEAKARGLRGKVIDISVRLAETREANRLKSIEHSKVTGI